MPSLLMRVRTQLGREQIAFVALAAAYFVSGKVGLAFAYVHPTVTALFPPTGIALGALLVLGYRVWPIILLASTLLYCSVLGVVPAAPLLGAANTGEGLLLAYLINRFAGGRHVLQRPKHTFRFAGLAALTAGCCGAAMAPITLAGTGL